MRSEYIIALSSFNTGAVLFVDAVNGNDSSGMRGSSTLKFLTPQVALAAALPGDVVFMFPGTYGGAITMQSGVTVEAIGIRDKVILSGAVTWAPSSGSGEVAGFQFLQFGGTFTVNTSAKTGASAAACRVDSCRFTGGAISYTGRSNATDNFQLISTFYNTIAIVANDVSVNIDGGLGQFSSITAGGSVDGVYFQVTDLEVAFGQPHGTVACSLGLVEISRGGIFTSFTTTGTGQINAWGTSVGDVTVGSGTSIIINGYPVLGTCAVNGALELHDSSAVDMGVSATGSVVMSDSPMSGALTLAGSAVLYNSDVTGAVGITGTGIAFLHDCSVSGLITTASTATLYAWGRAIFALDIAGYAELYNLDLGDVHVEGTSFAVFESVQQQGTTTVDVGGFVEQRGGSVTALLNSGTWVSTGVEMTTLTTQVGGASFLRGGRVGDVNVNDTTRVTGGCSVEGTITCAAGFFDGYAGDTRFATFVSSSGTFLPSGGDRYAQKTADFTPLVQECGVIYQNNGVDINATLPPWSQGLRWGFHIATANRFTVTNFDGSTAIYLDITPGAAGGYVNAIHPGSYIDVSAAAPGMWQVKVLAGQWTPDAPDV